LNPDELSKVLSAALALTYVPIFEGFGIPILEAFSGGTAVITSNVTSMPEVAGDAALLVDPFSVEDIAEKLELIYSNPKLREAFIVKGLERKKHFSWDLTAQRLWDCIVSA
jgi:glycosyltransferase involved in cell wall biosynthesis